MKAQTLLLKKHILLPILLILGLLNFAVWKVAKLYETETVLAQLRAQLDSFENTIEDNLRENSLTLSRMAKRWAVDGGTSEKRWRADAISYSSDLIGVTGVAYANRESIITWIEPHETNHKALGFKLNSETHRREALELAIKTRKAQVTRPLALRQDGMGYLLVHPVYKQGQLDGYVYSVGRYQDYFDILFHNTSYVVSVKDGDTLIYQNISIPSNSMTQKYIVSSRSPLAMSGNWYISLEPPLEQLSKLKGHIVVVATSISFVLSVLLFLLIHNLIQSKIFSAKIAEQDSWKNAILDSTELAVISTDTQGLVVSFNPAAERLLGYSASEIIGKHSPDIWHEAREIADRARKLSQEFGVTIEPGFDVFTFKAKKGLPDKDVWTFITKLGQQKSATLSIHCLKDNHTNVVGFVGVIEEITAEAILKQQVFEKEKTVSFLLEHTFDGYWDWDIKNDFQYMSPRFWEMFGYDPKQKKHHPSEWKKVISPESLEVSLETFKKHIESHGKHPYQYEARFIHRDGHNVWVICRGQVTDWAEDGSPLRMIGTHTNITEKVQAAEALNTIKARLEVALEGSNIGVWEWDLHTNNLVWDDQMFKIYGINRESFPNGYETWRKGVHPEDIQRLEQEVALAVQENKTFSFEFRYIREDGETSYVLTRGKVLTDSTGRASKMIGINWDITQIKLNERTLEEAKTLALESSKAKAQFLANMSHEIRTPLNGIIGMSNLLKETQLNNTQREYLEHIHQSSSILLSLINDILDLSKIESGRIELETVDFSLEQTVDFVVSSLSYSAKNKNLTINTHYEQPVPHWLLGDSSRLKQVLINFVNNAIKFTHEGSITIRSIILKENSDSIKFRLEVSDTGIGISESNQKKLFVNFSQADSSTHRKFGGTGLGLAISKLLIEKMNGEIGFSSQEGQGSTFWFVLELPKGKETLLSAPSGHELKNRPKQSVKILVAEDNLVNQKVAQATLEKLGFDCQVVANGREVLNIIERVDFDLILMDCQMPDLDGFETTLLIRENRNAKLSNIPIIAMTANAMIGDRERCIAAGMNDYVSKPISPGELLKAIERWS